MLAHPFLFVLFATARRRRSHRADEHVVLVRHQSLLVAQPPPQSLLAVVIASLSGLSSIQMASRAGNSTALRRLMTEYKQLTAGGKDQGELPVVITHLHYLCLGSPDGMFTAG